MLDLLSRLTRRDAPRTEADVQADVRQLFLTAPFQLEEGDVENVYLESPLGDRRRIDVEVGSSLHFAATRRHMRERLEESGVEAEISHIVEEMLS